MRDSPFRHLAPEITSEIFLHCLPEGSLPSAPSPCVREAPLLLGHICRFWREVAHSTPQLWTAVAVGGRNDRALQTMSLAYHTQVLDYWIARSGSCPISFDIEYRRSTAEVIPRILPIIEQILPHSQRWRSVRLKMPHPLCVTPLLAKINEGTPALEYLLIDSHFNSNPSELVDLTSADQLRHADLQGNFHLHLGSTIFRNVRVLTLNLQRLSVDECLALLEHFPLVEQLDIFIFLQQPEPTQVDNAILSLHHIRSLKVEFSVSDPGYMLDRFDLPAIQSLMIQGRLPPMAHPWNHVATLLERSRPPLKSLRMDGIRMSPDDLSSLLCSAPDLTHLVLKGMPARDELLHALVLPPIQPEDRHTMRPSPLLQSLQLRDCGAFSGIAMAAVLESRWTCVCQPPGHHSPNCKSLQQLILNRCSYNGNPPAITRCVSEGLEIKHINP